MNLETPVTASTPTQAMSIPKRPDMIPLGREFPETPARSEIPRIAIEKYSTEVNFETKAAIGAASTRSKRAPMMPPKEEAKREVSSACRTLPFFARGYPSKVVAIAEFVPGVLSVMALMEPPYIPPT